VADQPVDDVSEGIVIEEKLGLSGQVEHQEQIVCFYLL
jgi:hypothetical protein